MFAAHFIADAFLGNFRIVGFRIRGREMTSFAVVWTTRVLDVKFQFCLLI